VIAKVEWTGLGFIWRISMETIANDAARRFMIVPNGSKVVGGNVMDFEKIMHYCLGKQNRRER
jgi:hypothetical protein